MVKIRWKRLDMQHFAIQFWSCINPIEVRWEMNGVLVMDQMCFDALETKFRMGDIDHIGSGWCETVII